MCWLQDTMVVTDQRVLYLNRQWVLGCCAATREEAFFLNDLQVCIHLVTQHAGRFVGRQADVLSCQLHRVSCACSGCDRASAHYRRELLLGMKLATHGSIRTQVHWVWYCGLHSPLLLSQSPCPAVAAVAAAVVCQPAAPGGLPLGCSRHHLPMRRRKATEGC